VVKKGDTLGLIARTYGTSTQQLVTANNLGKNPILRVGHTLIIPMSETTPPPPKSAATGTRTTTRTTRTTSTSPATGRANRYYTVRSGDTLTTIAGRFHTTVDKLKTWNHLSSTRLAVGKRLIIGTAANSAEPAN